jgi:hypothetical protein
VRFLLFTATGIKTSVEDLQRNPISLRAYCHEMAINSSAQPTVLPVDFAQNFQLFAKRLFYCSPFATVGLHGGTFVLNPF